MANKRYTPNDQRSIVKNSTSAEYKADKVNQQRQQQTAAPKKKP